MTRLLPASRQLESKVIGRVLKKRGVLESKILDLDFQVNRIYRLDTWQISSPLTLKTP